ncbi:hypothetical protein MHO82_06670 [Vibrio sp. Of7-15]|uniref:hypothetical protein n=1 Tax=Vibrio sp. Of7-15 TaxID=2724879 RepID=UPI001EF320CC|nr:hypothetical protein [Vibrio sp. Of7-15]MCG7496539.1 hypothetical protein [Vibrio sp. Of7-15]
MLKKVTLISLVISLALVVINWAVWEVFPTDSVEETSTLPSSQSVDVHDYSVDTLNDQVSVQQIRKVLFTDDNTVKNTIKERESSELENLDELENQINTLSKEIETLKNSSQ